MRVMNPIAAARRGPTGLLALWLAVLIALGVLALLIGRITVRPADLAAIVLAKLSGSAHPAPSTIETVVFELRAPRIVAAIVVGAALAAAGAAYQALFRNPLVSPDILGVSAGAALGAMLGMFFSLDVFAIQGLAFLGGVAAVAIVYVAGNSIGGRDPLLALVLTGVVIGTLLGSCVALVKYLADPYNQLPAMTFWLLGSLAAVAPGDLHYAIPAVLLGLVPMYLLRWRMNLLMLSDDEARALGVDTGRLRITVVCAATLMTAASVAISGIIGWIGLLVPHAARLSVGPAFARMLPIAMLMGACYLLGVDTMARSMAQIELPPGVLTALIGAPFFLWLLAVSRRGSP